jgi:MFS family permease
MKSIAAASSDDTSQPGTKSPWAPFGNRVFAVIWFAVLAANIGTWMRDVGAGWLMTSLSASATAVAMVQVATTLPVFLLSLPAGALADIVDRRRLLVITNTLLAGVALAMGVVTQLGLMTPALLVASLLIAGVGAAVMVPVQQSLTPLLVGRAQLRSAVALNSMGFNVSRAIGPAIGGVVVATAGVAYAFYADALSYLAVIAAFWWWKGASARASAGVPEQLASAMRVGVRFALHAPAFQRTVLRAGSFFLFASAYWALLPIIARRELGGGPAYYGTLLTSIGLGAVIGAIALPKLRRHVSAEGILRIGTVATMLVLIVLAAVRDKIVVAGVMAVAGSAWIVVLTTANVSAQTHLPNWVRGRALAVYLTAFYGALALGSLVWGQLADRTSVAISLWTAAALGAIALVVAWRKPMPDTEPDLSPSRHWPDPTVSPTLAQSPGADRGPVLVTVEYDVAPDNVDQFLAALALFSHERLRDGAYQWGVYQDAGERTHFIESFLLPSWREHLRQHERVTRADAELQERVRRFHVGPQPPRVRHYIWPERRFEQD